VAILLLPFFLRAAFGPISFLNTLGVREIENNAIYLFIAVVALWIGTKKIRRANAPGFDILFLLVIFLTIFQNDSKWLHIESDGVGYFSYLHTLYMDRDLDFTNEYEDLDAYRHGVWAYSDPQSKIPKTSAAGTVPNLFAIGPSLLWYPFYGLTDLFFRPDHPRRTGYETPYLQSVYWAVLFYGFAGTLLLYLGLARFFSRTASLAAVLSVLLLSPLYFYLKNLVFYSHVYSFFAVSLFVYFFAKYHGSRLVGHWAVFGLLAGFAALMRWQNAAIVAIPAVTAVIGFGRAAKDGRAFLRLLAKLAALSAGFVFALAPQLLAFQILYGKVCVIPQGDTFLRMWPHWLWQVLFSPFHGLFHWHPLLVFGLLGFFLRPQGKPSAGAALYSGATGFALQAYINGSISQYHGGGSFGGRRFCDSLAFLAFGFANFFEHILEMKKVRVIALISANVFFILNAMMERAWSWEMLPREIPYSLPQLIMTAGRAFFQVCQGPHKRILFYLFFILFVNVYVILGSQRQTLVCGPEKM
jgi:hypothetical protein